MTAGLATRVLTGSPTAGRYVVRAYDDTPVPTARDSDAPSAALVEMLAGVYLRNGTRIKPSRTWLGRRSTPLLLQAVCQAVDERRGAGVPPRISAVSAVSAVSA